MNHHGRFHTTIALFITGALALAACGGSSSSSGTNRNRNVALTDAKFSVDDNIEQVAVGCRNNVVLTHVGDVISWGDFGDAPTKTARLIASSCWNAVAITVDNQFKIWGQEMTNIFEAGAPDLDFANVTQIGISTNYGLALTNEGKLEEWGDDSWTGAIPKEIASLTITKFALGEFGVLAIDSNNKLHAWNGAQTQFPTTWNGMSVTSIAAGDGLFAVVDSKGKLHGWDVFAEDEQIPANILSGTYSSVSIAKSNSLSIAVSTDGKLVMWGEDPTNGEKATFPDWISTDVPQYADSTAVFIGLGTVFVQYSEEGHSWFSSWSYGNETNAYLPYAVFARGRLNPIAAGGSHTYVINDTYGIEQIDDSKTTTSLPEGNDFVAIAAGMNHGLALHRDGTLAGWSDSQYNGTDFDAQPAAQIPKGLTNVTQFAAGNNWSLAVSNDTKLYQWGTIYSPANNTVSVPDGYFAFEKLKATYNHAVALVYDNDTETRRVISWGDNSAHQTKVPANVETAAAAGQIRDVAAGFNCSAALHEDGTITMWGDCNGYKSLLKPPTDDDAYTIELGTDFGVVLSGRTGATVWGENTYDYATIPNDSIFPTYLAVGRFHIVIASWDGGVVAWGDNSQNQTTIPDSFKFVNLEMGYGGPPDLDEEHQKEQAKDDVATGETARDATSSSNATSPSSTAQPAAEAAAPSITLKSGEVVTAPSPPEAQPAPAPEPVSAKSTVQVVVAPDPSVVRVGAVVSTGTAAKIMGVKKATNIRFGKVDAGSSKNCVKVASGIKAKKSGSCVVNVTYTYKKKTIGAKINIVVTP